MLSRRLSIVAAALAAAAAAVVALLIGLGSGRGHAPCPAGYAPLAGEQARELAEHAGGGRAICLKRGARLPETFADLARVNTATGQRLGIDTPHALAAAVRAKSRLARTAIPGTAGTWSPVGKGPLHADDTSYSNAASFGLVTVAGRVVDFAYDDAGKQLFAAVANGGVWRSTDLGDHWTSIADQLPTQTIGAVGWTPAGGGTVIALTGDNAFGGNTYPGLGAYWSNDTGRTWHKAKGLPDGAMGFRVQVQPNNPEVVYAATGFGLYRSTDAGRSYVNVALPTGDCAGNSLKPGCFLANVVTDVVVQAPDRFGHQGGAVLAAVGWRSGNQKNIDGTIQAPSNGVYESPTGEPGSFTKLAAPGFAAQDRIGRVSLGVAHGAAQNHDYVYAVVQDALLFRSGKIEGLDIGSIPNPLDPKGDLSKTPTYLNGVYMSPDFGRTWRLMEAGEQFLLPTNGSTLAALSPFGFGPGIQAWYNSFIEPEPTQQSSGVPTDIVMGLEEIYQSRTTGLPQLGITDFAAVGPYTSGGPLCILTLGAQLCSEKQKLQPGDTTTHPDQHGGIFVPDGSGGSWFIVGNDGGVYKQHVPGSGLMKPAGFGKGANLGFNTLLPYSVARAKDGTTYAGLQDNGEIKIFPDGHQVEIFGGDGTNTLVDPDNSNLVLESLPSAGLNLSHDGGHNFDQVDPQDIQDATFLAPLVMDPTDKHRLAVAGRNIFVTDVGLDNLTSDSWNGVYDLGTKNHPGDANAQSSDTDPSNVASAMAMRGKTLYVGWCGSCDPIKDNVRYHGGIATNVGGTWHLTKAAGLPQRLINGVVIDPSDPKTIYVALGSSTVRQYVPPRGAGDDGTDASGGFVYKSTDGGETFTDITGDLPKVGVTSLLQRGNQLLASTTVGVFASQSLRGRRWGLMGNNLPAAPIYAMTQDPADANQLLVATLGRGVWAYKFADCRDTARPRSRFAARLARAARAGHRLRLRGVASDRGCRGLRGRVKRVRVSIARVVGKRCRLLQADGRLAPRTVSCRKTHYLRARGARKWSFTSRRALPAGRYIVRVRAVDAAGNVERASRANRLRLTLR